jgi:hypothetical protein
MNAPRKSRRGVLGSRRAVLRLVSPMHFKYSVDGRGARAAMSLILLSTIAACGSSAGGGAAPGGSNDGGHDNGDSTTTGPGDSGAAMDAGEPSDGSRGGTDAVVDTDAGHDAMTNTEGGTVPTDGGDGGIRDIGSCCSAQTTPGCSNATLEVCVCEKDQSCCTTAWGLQCALIVQQKYCQTGVRDCVCGTDAGQWGQTQCCATDWSSSCDSVATIKCGAAQGCF